MQGALRAVELGLANDEVEQLLAVLLQRDGVEGTALTTLHVGGDALGEISLRAGLPVIGERSRAAEVLELTEGAGGRSGTVVEGQGDHTGCPRRKLKVGSSDALGSLLFSEKSSVALTTASTWSAV